MSILQLLFPLSHWTKAAFALAAFALCSCALVSVPQQNAQPITIRAVGYNIKVPSSPPIELTVNDGATAAVREVALEGIRVGGAAAAAHAVDKLAESAQQSNAAK